MKSLKKNISFKIKMIPVPRVLSSSCGTAIALEIEDFTAEYLNGLEYDSLFEWLKNDDYVKID